MPDNPPVEHHISSAVVLTLPDHGAAIACAIGLLSETEVFHVENGKLIVVLEGGTVGEIGDRLNAIALMDGVLAANLVYEHVVSLADLEETS